MADYSAALTADDAGVRIAVRVVPRAARNAVVGLQGAAVKVRLQAPPVEGKANAALVAFLAEVLAVDRRDVRVSAGGRSRDKTVTVAGLGRDTAARRLAEIG